jgi:hypothetical protein
MQGAIVWGGYTSISFIIFTMQGAIIWGGYTSTSFLIFKNNTK